MKPLKQAAGLLAQQGRHGDTILAHINPKEAGLLKALGGSGTRNPRTGLLEFYDDEGNDGGGSLSDAMDNASYNDAFSSDSYDGSWGGLDYNLTEEDIMNGANLGRGIYSPEMEYTLAYGAAPANNSVGHGFSLANQDAWNNAYGNNMAGGNMGMPSDFGAWLSRNGIISQPGAGQKGLLDNVPVAGLLGAGAGLLGGPLASLAVNLIGNYMTNSNNGVSNASQLAGKDVSRELSGMLGGNLLAAINPALGQIGGSLAKSGFDKLTDGQPITQADPVDLTDTVLDEALPEAAQAATRTASAAGARPPFSIGAPQQSFLSYGSRRYG